MEHQVTISLDEEEVNSLPKREQSFLVNIFFFFFQSSNKDTDIPMWKKLTIATKITPAEDENKNNVSSKAVVKNDNIIINVSKPSNDKAKKRPDPVIRASNSVSNQDFLALAVIEGNLSKVQSVVEAYTALLGISYCRNKIEISLPT